MNNPYQTVFMKTLSAKIPPLAWLLKLVLLPRWLTWQFEAYMIRNNMYEKWDETLYRITKPIRAVRGFFVAWAESRSLKQFVIALPVVVIALLGFSAFYINANRNRGQALLGYQGGAMKALADQDYRQADFLFSKLINHPSYKDNDEVMFRAMLAAEANKNIPRATALREKLLRERQYEPVKQWVAENAINQGVISKEVAAELIAMATEMVNKQPRISTYEYWQRTLARLQMSVGNPELAIEVLKQQEGHLRPESWLLLSQAYTMAGRNADARHELIKLIEYLDAYDPDAKKYLREKVEGLSALSGLTKNIAKSKGYLERAFDVLERQRRLSIDTSEYDSWLSHMYLRMFQVLIQENTADSRLQAFQYLERVVTLEDPPAKIGGVLNGVVDTSSDYSMLSGQIMAVLANEGGSGAHLAMALDAWAVGNIERTKLHCETALSINPSAMKVLLFAAMDSARSSDPNKLDLNIFQGSNRSTYQRAMDLMDLVASVDGSLAHTASLNKCYVHSLRKNWHGIIKELSVAEETFEGMELLNVYEWLDLAYSGLGDDSRSKEYKKKMYELVAKLRIEKKNEQ